MNQMNISLWFELIRCVEFPDCFDIRLVCSDANCAVMHRVKKMENLIAVLYLLNQLGYNINGNPGSFFEKCVNCDSLFCCRKTIKFDSKICTNHYESLSDVSTKTYLSDGKFYIIASGINNMYHFDGRWFVKDRGVQCWMTDIKKTIIINQNEMWHIEINTDDSILIHKQPSDKKLIINGLKLNQDNLPDTSTNLLCSDQAIVIEGSDVDSLDWVVHYCNLNQKICHCIKFSKSLCNVRGWTNECMLIETDNHLIKVFANDGTWIAKLKPTKSCGLFYFLNQNDPDRLICPHCWPYVHNFDEMADESIKHLTYFHDESFNITVDEL